MKHNLALIIIGTLLTLAGVIGGVTWSLRLEIREQLLSREAATLHAVAQHEALFQGEALIDLVLNMVEMEGVIGIRLFDEAGVLIETLPDTLVGADLNERLAGGSEPMAELHPEVLLDTIFADPFSVLSLEPLPLLMVLLPIRSEGESGIRGYAEFLMDGSPIERALAELDRKLLGQACTAFLGGAFLCILILAMSFRKLERKNRDLAQANRELLLRAKTSAIGAISSHLFHGLKNTLTGLELAINGAEESTGHSDARRSTDRLKQMVQEILEVIQEEEFGISYELTGQELLSVLQEKLKGAVTDAGVQLLAHSEGECDFSNRDGNLILLILENLVRNAIEVTPRGGTVQCRFIADSAKGGIFTVTDSGPGIPASRLEHLFEPGSSTKTGGSGLGLAISRQLARQLGGELELGYSHSRGTQFQLVVSKSSADAD